MTFSSTGKATHRPNLYLPLLGVLPDEDVDLEQATLCGHDDKREHHVDGFDPSFFYGFSVLILSALLLLEIILILSLLQLTEQVPMQEENGKHHLSIPHSKH
jgi:hypothetical protein